MTYDNNNFTFSDKVNFLDCLNSGNINFDKFFSNYILQDLNPATIKKLLENVWIKFDEDNLDIQESFYNLLDKIMDGIGQYRYHRLKNTFGMSSINQINDTVLKAFRKIDSDNEKFILSNLSDTLISIAEDSSSCFKDYFKRVKDLYSEYKKEGNLSFQISTDFYNEILNKKQNNFISFEKKEMINELCKKLSYAKRKEDSIITSSKLRKIDNALKRHRYDELGTTENEIKDKLKNFASYLSSLKELRREKVVVSDSQNERLNQLFLDGVLAEEDIDKIFPGVSKKVKKIILDKYMQFKLPFLEKIEDDLSDLLNIKLGYNYNNYKIVSKDSYHENLLKVFNVISEELGQELLDSLEQNSYISILILFIDYFPELSVERVLSIIRNFPKIVDNMLQEGDILSNSLNDVMNKSYKLFTNGEIYENTGAIYVAALGEDIVERIVISDEITSRNPKDYSGVYLKMLKRAHTRIPPVSGEFADYYYESAHDADYERLLIGKNCCGSCLGINGAGEDAYIDSLTTNDADVIMFKSKYTNEFLGRCLCFRKGNYVILAPIHDKKGLSDNIYSSELLDNIASQMLDKAKKSNDTLEYVLSSSICLVEKDYPIVEDDSFMHSFPHSDLSYSAFLLGSVDEFLIDINENRVMPVTYDTVRDKVKIDDEVTNSDLNRLRALNILFIDDLDLKKYQIDTFSLSTKDKYDEIYMGQDWFVAIKDGKVVDKVILPISDKRQENEVITVYKHLQDEGIINDAAHEMVNNFSSIRH